MIRKSMALLKVISLFFLIQPTTIMAQDENILLHPGNRYARQNLNTDILSYWPQPISIQFLKIGDDETRRWLLTEFLPLGRAAGVDMKIVGFPNDMFNSAQVISKDAAILVFEYNLQDQENIISGKYFSKVDYFDLSKANPAMQNILNGGLVKQAEGCLAKWQASNANVIEGFVLAISETISEVNKKTCISTVAPSAFGISPHFSQYNAEAAFKEPPLNKDDMSFSDRSELLLELSAATFCRKNVGTHSAECPLRLINSIFLHHAELVGIEGN